MRCASARSIEPIEIISIVRPEDSLPWMVTRYLECGVDGLMLPLIPNAAVAQQMVDRMRFSAPFDHADRFIILMIETLEAVNNLPEILRVEGVDAFLVAPGDLAMSMGVSPITYEWQKGRRPAELVAAVDRLGLRRRQQRLAKRLVCGMRHAANAPTAGSWRLSCRANPGRYISKNLCAASLNPKSETDWPCCPRRLAPAPDSWSRRENRWR